jgi:hypothetical protein
MRSTEIHSLNSFKAGVYRDEELPMYAAEENVDEGIDLNEKTLDSVFKDVELQNACIGIATGANGLDPEAAAQQQKNGIHIYLKFSPLQQKM